MDKLKSFINNYFFYRVPKEEKNTIRAKIACDDHRSFSLFAMLLMITQVVLLIRSFISYGFDAASKPTEVYFRIAYSALLIAVLIGYLLLRISYENERYFGYFCVINTLLVIIQMYAISISAIDSYTSPNLAVYSYVTITLTAVIVLEPWIVAIDLTVNTIIVNLHFVLNYGITSHVIINTVVVLVVAITISTYLFYKRIKKLNLEIEIINLNDKLKQRAVIDDLTKLYNRRYLTEHIDTPMIIGSRPTGVIMFDIDKFKRINDYFGHAVGDDTLFQLGSIINDIVKEPNYAVRYGGEEFLVYVKETTKTELMNLSEEIRRKLEACSISLDSDNSFNFTVSVGCSIASKSVTYSALIEKADEALYISKQKNNVSTFLDC